MRASVRLDAADTLRVTGLDCTGVTVRDEAAEGLFSPEHPTRDKTNIELISNTRINGLYLVFMNFPNEPLWNDNIISLIIENDNNFIRIQWSNLQGWKIPGKKIALHKR